MQKIEQAQARTLYARATEEGSYNSRGSLPPFVPTLSPPLSSSSSSRAVGGIWQRLPSSEGSKFQVAVTNNLAQ